MATRKINPTSPGQRGMTRPDFSEITTDKPEKSLLKPLTKSGGRNNTGRITTRHIGGGHKRQYRVIDFKRDKTGVVGFVKTVEYDPNRNVRISLVVYADGEKRYIIAPVGLKDGDVVMSGENVEIKVGNSLPLSQIPVGSLIHNIELEPNKGGQLVRSAGNEAQLMAKEGRYATIRLPSGEMRKVLLVCRATIGTVGNIDHELVSLGKAGRKRHMGVRPSVRGVAMNPNDHKHGGGEGKSPVGMASPVTPWNKPALGYKTRKRKNRSNRLMVKRVN